MRALKIALLYLFAAAHAVSAVLAIRDSLDYLDRAEDLLLGDEEGDHEQA